jgi:hypothetical protein
MSGPKSGIRTSEFWVTAVVNVVSAVVAILAVQGLTSDREAELYIQLARALASAVAPVVMAYVTGQYAQSRTRVKEAHYNGS